MHRHRCWTLDKDAEHCSTMKILSTFPPKKSFRKQEVSWLVSSIKSFMGLVRCVSKGIVKLGRKTVPFRCVSLPAVWVVREIHAFEDSSHWPMKTPTPHQSIPCSLRINSVLRKYAEMLAPALNPSHLALRFLFFLKNFACH